jgi:hypothetical protein
MMVDDVVEAIFQQLCIRHQVRGQGADMSLAELRIMLGVTEAQLISTSPSRRRIA